VLLHAAGQRGQAAGTGRGLPPSRPDGADHTGRGQSVYAQQASWPRGEQEQFTGALQVLVQQRLRFSAAEGQSRARKGCGRRTLYRGA
jgi:hypothetical protein